MFRCSQSPFRRVCIALNRSNVHFVDVRGCKILITGASSGIGRALAIELAERGATLAIAARGADRLAEVADRTGATVHPVDLSIRGEAARLAAEVGPVDILINNAGRRTRRSGRDHRGQRRGPRRI
ncbi:hypothetical protein CQY22_016530 [Mycolicibacterium brumae]|uniref:SDR family NAD(P)-dependent oxidoreductase n=1 Tax=Mycolicibacterium brumae TaxID=85968 RepID=A0A2G5P596_9MYCO|nr:hypothetical protein CQY22_016530 [Mycolicibacterium brumae]